MTPQDYVTFHTAKLLKDAGFPQEYKLSLGGTLIATDDGTICRPSLWDAMKWLRERYGIHIEGEPYFIDKYGNKTTVWRTVTAILPEQMEGIGEDRYTTYEAACDAGIAAACQWLIAHVIGNVSKSKQTEH